MCTKIGVIPPLGGLHTSPGIWWKKEIVFEETDKAIHDEQTLARVLEAAYVLQEHNRELRNKKADPKLIRDRLVAEQVAEHRAISATGVPQTQDALPTSNADSAKASSTLILAQIVEIQHQVQMHHVELENVMSLVAERLTEFAGASGAAIGILDSKKVPYWRAAGVMAPPTETEVPREKALCVDCLRTGKVLHCADVNLELRLNQDECRRRGIRAMLAVPVFHDGVVAGSLEVYFPKTEAFTEEDVHTCQLMAGLLSEALARNEEVNRKKSLAIERAVMLEALEKLKPSLAALADAADTGDAGNRSPAGSTSTFVCRACGHELIGHEQFCGNCGLPRSGDYEAPNTQSTIATLWYMQEAMKKNPRAQLGDGTVVREKAVANLGQINSDEAVHSVEAQSPKPFSPAEPLRHKKAELAELSEARCGADFENAAHADLEIPRHTIPENDVKAPVPTGSRKIGTLRTSEFRRNQPELLSATGHGQGSRCLD